MAKTDRPDDALALLQQLLALTGGQLDNFDPQPPPSAIRRFLRTADLRQLQGLLVELLAAMRKS